MGAMGWQLGGQSEENGGGSLGQHLGGTWSPGGVTRTKPPSTLTAAPSRLLTSLVLPGPIPQCRGENLGFPRWEGRPQTRILNPRNWQPPALHWGAETPGSCCGRTRRGTREQGDHGRALGGTGVKGSMRGQWAKLEQTGGINGGQLRGSVV